MKNDYLIQKKPLSALVLFSVPIIVGNLFQQFYTMADSAIVGRFVSEQALAAVGASYALTNIFVCVAIGGGIGASVIVSRYFGAKEYENMKSAVFTALLSFLAVSIVLGGDRSSARQTDHGRFKYSRGRTGSFGAVSEYLFSGASFFIYV